MESKLPTDYLCRYSEKPNKGQNTVGLSEELLAIISSNIHQPGMFYQEQLCKSFGWFVYKQNYFFKCAGDKIQVWRSVKFFVYDHLKLDTYIFYRIYINNDLYVVINVEILKYVFTTNLSFFGW